MTRYKKQDPEIKRCKFINAAMGTSAVVGVLILVSALGSSKPVFRLTPWGVILGCGELHALRWAAVGLFHTLGPAAKEDTSTGALNP